MCACVLVRRAKPGDPCVASHPVLKAIASKHNMTPWQVCPRRHILFRLIIPVIEFRKVKFTEKVAV